MPQRSGPRMRPALWKVWQAKGVLGSGGDPTRRRGRTIAQGAVRTPGVVVLPPHLDDHTCFFERVENLAVQAFIAQLAVERFAVAVLPGTAGFDKHRSCTDRIEPRAHTLRTHLRAVVAPHVLGRAVREHRLTQRFDDVKTVQSTRHANRQAFARVFIDQREQAQAAPIVRARLDEIVTPYVIPMFGPQSDARAIVQPQPPPRLVPCRNLQPFATSDALDPIRADSPAANAQQRRDATVAIAPVFTGQFDNGFRGAAPHRRARPADNAACRAVDSPAGTHAVHSCLSHERGERRRDAARDLKVSLRDVLQDLLLHCQLSHGAPQLGVLFLQVFELARLLGL